MKYLRVEVQYAWIKAVSVNPVDAKIHQARTQSTP